jgi:nucleotide-binding universal stress UspA family protein
MSVEGLEYCQVLIKRSDSVIEKVIVPLDGSVTAEIALPYAQELIARRGAELTLLFVKEAQDYRSENIIQAYLDSLVKKSIEAASVYLQGKTKPNFKIQTKILTGQPAEEILKFVENLEGGRIIMASHGQSGVGTRWTLGSVADKVARATTKPITMIRADREKPAIHAKGLLHTILVPLDGSKRAEIILPYVKEMAKLVDAEVILLQVLQIQLVTYKMIEVPVPEETKQAARDYLEGLVADLKKEGINARYEIWETRGDVAGEIVEYTEKKLVDLVAMSTHGHTGPSRWMMGSVSNKVLRQGNAPLMLVRNPAEK